MEAQDYIWRAVREADLPALAALDAAVRAVDGPASVSVAAYADLLAAPGVALRCAVARSAPAGIVAAGWARVAGGRAELGGNVHPAHRRRGLGTHLLRWSEAAARDLGAFDTFTIRNEVLTPGSDALYTRAGYTPTFVQDWMQRDLAAPLPALPGALPTLPWTAATAPRFFAVYADAFSTRPDFQPPPAAHWIAEYEHDPDFRPDLSRLAVAGDEPVAFLAAATLDIDDLGRRVGWVAQVGSRPAWRGRGAAAALIAGFLEACRREGLPAVGLHVNVNNPGAIGVYRQLGFVPVGRRARYSKATPPLA